jgi:cytochrome P450
VALTYITYFLAKHTAYIQKLADELSIYGNIEDLKLAEMDKLPLLNAVIRESLRLAPPGPGPFGRVCPPEGRVLGGHFIPGGVLLNHNISKCR